MSEPYLYPDTSPHLRVWNSLVDQPVLFLERRHRDTLKRYTHGVLYGMGFTHFGDLLVAHPKSRSPL